MIERTFQLHGPFDGIFAFSQGAALASLMCLMKERKELAPAIDFKFAIMVASFKSLSSKHAKWYGPEAMRVTLPTLHVIGAEDRVIKKQLSEELLPLFEGGHHSLAPGWTLRSRQSSAEAELLPVPTQGDPAPS